MRANVDRVGEHLDERGASFKEKREDLKGERKKCYREKNEMFFRCGSKQAILLPSVRHSSYIEKHQRPRNREGQEEKEKTRKMKENQSLGKPD